MTSGANGFDGIACPSTSDCYAVNFQQGEIIATTNGGSTWSFQTVPVIGPGDSLVAIACPSTSECVAVGTNYYGTAGVLFATTNGGATWVSETLPADISYLLGVACGSLSNCYAVGQNATVNPDGTTTTTPVIVGTTDGGTTWSSQTLPTGVTSGGLNAIACPSASDCYAVGRALTPAIFATTNGGSTWTSQTAANAATLDVACPSTLDCVAVNGALIQATTDGGATWTAQTVPSGVSSLNGVTCTAAYCLAVGTTSTGSGVVISNVTPPPATSVLLPSNGATVTGDTWLDAAASSQVGVSSVTFEVSGGSLSDQVISGSTPTLYGWIGAWNSTSVPNGTYTLQSVATDTDGTSTTSAPVTITVNNPPATTSVVIPSDGATQSGTAAILDAAASAGATGVQFELNGGGLVNSVIATATPTIFGWLAEWNTTTVPNGTYALQSVATEADGTSVISAPITITVSNPLP